jgi:uncharacterized protein YndB with AHSA1/START domain
MATARVTPDQDAVVSEIEIAAPPERVFRALVERDQALQWAGNEQFEITSWEMDARPGGKWRFVSKERGSQTVSVSEIVHNGEILEFDPPRLLVYTWFANWHEDPGQRTIVRWELTPKSGGTQVKVTHSGLAQMPEACKGYSQGWPGLLDSVRRYLEK